VPDEVNSVPGRVHDHIHSRPIAAKFLDELRGLIQTLAMRHKEEFGVLKLNHNSIHFAIPRFLHLKYGPGWSFAAI
jgi:hypothetical protein